MDIDESPMAAANQGGDGEEVNSKAQQLEAQSAAPPSSSSLFQAPNFDFSSFTGQPSPQLPLSQAAAEIEARRLCDEFYTPKSSNDPNFKYKYPEANPTPLGEDDALWNKVYTAADSRFYNYGGKTAHASAAKRKTGETYTLAVEIHGKNKEKYYESRLAELLGKKPKPPKPDNSNSMAPKKSAKKQVEKKDTAFGSGEDSTAADGMMMTISEKLKTQGRTKKAAGPASTGESSTQGTPAPTSVKMDSPASQIDKPTAPKKKGTATAIKRPSGPPKQPKKVSAVDAMKKSEKNNRASATPGSSAPSPSDSSSNDGGEYCICKGPDDHRKMVQCEGDCRDWFHCTCLAIDEEDADKLLDHFICPNCTVPDGQPGARFTTWKRLCRYYNCNGACRNPARVNNNPPSKYCSDECKQAFWEFVIAKLRTDDAPSLGGALSLKEVTMLAAKCKTVADWRKLQEKPRLEPKEGADPNRPVGLDYLTEEDIKKIAEINQEKSEILAEIDAYAGQGNLLRLIVNRVKHANAHPGSDSKDLCGYDSRLALNCYEFGVYMETQEAKTAFETAALGPKTPEVRALFEAETSPGVPAAPDQSHLPDALKDMCLKTRKKCVHIGWIANHGGDYAGMTEHGKKRLAKLDKLEAEIISDAEYREATKAYDARNETIQHF